MGNVGVKPDTLADGAINERTDTVITAADEILFGDVTDSNNLKKDTVQGILDLRGAGAIVQVVNVHDGAVATGTTAIPMDDTIPQNTEGDEYMTLAITPTSATNKLYIEVNIFIAESICPNWHIAALFQDSTADALASSREILEVNNRGTMLSIKHFMAAGTTSSTTFKVRAGMNSAGTTTINGASGARQLGGTLASSITIWEIAV